MDRWGVVDIEWFRQLCCATNPAPKNSWIHNRWHKKMEKDGKTPIGDPEDHAIWVSSTYENKRHLTKKYIASLEARPLWFKNSFLYGLPGFIPPDGEPVYKQFNYDLFVSNKTLEPDKSLPLVAGWDIGPTAVNKAVLIGQLDSRGTLIVLTEIMQIEPGLGKFAQYVNHQLRQFYPGCEVSVHFADPVAFHITQTDSKSPAEIIREEGIDLLPGEEGIGVRLDAVTKVMGRYLDGAPGLYIDAARCPTLVEGFLGGYRYKIIDDDNEHYSMKPIKDRFSHIQDALQTL